MPAIAVTIRTVSIQRAAPVGGEEAERQPDDDRDRHGGGGERQRVGQPLQDQVEHRLLAADGVAEVAMEQAPEEVQVLDADRLVEAEVAADRLDLLRRRALALGVHDLDGIARHEMDQQRHRDRGHEDREQAHGEPSGAGIGTIALAVPT